VFHFEQKRGLEGTLKGAVLQSFVGMMVHDERDSCTAFISATYGLRNAHHLREL